MNDKQATSVVNSLVFVDPDTKKVTVFSEQEWTFSRVRPENDKEKAAVMAESRQPRWLPSLAFRSGTVVVERASSAPFKLASEGLDESIELMRILGIEGYELEDGDREFEDLEEDEDGEPENLYEEGSGYVIDD